MKRLLLFLVSFSLIGAGCIAQEPKLQEAQAGDWYLAFDLPDGWVMSPQYKLGEEDPSPSDVNRDLKDIVLQSTVKSVFTSSGMISEQASARVEAGEVITEDFVSIRVLKLDSRRVVPSEAEDLGDGFYKLQICEDGGECQLGGQFNYQYYYVNGEDKYQFLIAYQGEAITQAEEVILSAVPVVVKE